MERIKVAVVGCGVFGRHHARIYSELPEAELVGVYDTDAARAAAVAAEFKTRALASLDEVAHTARAASVAVPTKYHLQAAKPLIEAGLDILVEKPITHSLAEAEELIATAAKHQRILQVGHLERCNPAVRVIRPRITRPLFFEVHRLSIFTPRSLDVDVMLDLMIHDLDLVLSFVNSPVQDLQAVGLAVLTPFVDIANVRLAFANGCVANLTASRVSTEKVRKIRFFQPGEYISLDLTRRDALVFSVKTPGPGDSAAAGLAAMSAPSAAAGIAAAMIAANKGTLGGATGLPSIVHQHLKGDDKEPLGEELSAFLACVRERKAPEVGGKEARAALEVALRAASAIAAHAKLLGLGAVPSARGTLSP